MPSDNNTNDTKDSVDSSKVVEFVQKSSKNIETDRKQKQKPGHKSSKSKKSIGWLLGVIVLVLLAIIMVLPSTFTRASSGYKVVFGTYDGIDVAYEVSPSGSGNHFANQVQGLMSQNPNAASDYNQLYQLWNSAYQNEVFFVAANALAKKAGLDKTAGMEQLVAQYIRESGYYTNDQGVFDATIYNSTPALQKSYIKKNVQEQLPTQIIISDLYTVRVSSAEKNYISDAAATVRDFEYVSFTTDSYPDALAVEYATQNPEAFSQVGISRITVADETLALSLKSQIESGTLSFEDAATANSIDGYAQNGGAAGTFRGYELSQFITQDIDRALVLSSSDGALVGPVAVSLGYALLRIDAAAQEADYSDPGVLSLIKTRIAQADPERMDAVLREEAQTFLTAASATSFVDAAEAASFDVTVVATTPVNVSDSQLMTFSLSTTDPVGFLSIAAEDSTIHKELFTAPSGTTLGPYKAGTTYIVAQTGDDAYDEDMKSYLDLFYDSPYITQQLVAQDAIGTVLASDKLQDNFMSAFFSHILGLGSSR
ncbi:peptidylprolyl isomerase [Parasphaerochaeta coccoides]|uniref:PpiC-type peptidyl-prolyl cis-trans isomerase n=1 Tax=Parasphaerochaeta coccoides (strain ATCC BAA-1237 / DSM 17374 / SPN1) TaxID=760011 RepID=F4GH62_PARC1|nr:peptidylprolyl isomerase [Parasphaerochaeta coccoides]AEC01537.1 PpiC-type peptidyl-prolyl cis-trans isomerase [Parasphaerochaeta coccoides DSM 17374]